MIATSTMLHRITGLAIVLLAGGACAQSATPAPAPAYTFPTYRSAAEVTAACDALLASARADERRLQALAPSPSAELLAELDRMYIRYEDTLGPLQLLGAVHPDKGVRDAADACDLRYQTFANAFQQNARVHALLGQVKPADAIDAQFLRDRLDAFEDSGVALSRGKQARAKALGEQITRLSQLFDRRIRDDKTRVAFTAEELDGVPAEALKDRQRDAQGRYLFGLDYPSYDAIIDNARRGDTRERMWRAFQGLGGEANLKTLRTLGQLRREYARLFGFESYADFAMRRRMAHDAATAQAFLGTVKDAVAQREVADLALLRDAKARDLKQPIDATTLARWDATYYTLSERRNRFQLDTEEFRTYFPPQASLDFVFSVATRLFGLQFEPRQQALWHPEAQAYEVRDIASQQVLGSLFVDLYPREGKYNHAAVWGFRNPSTLAQRKPAAGLVVNFNRQGLNIDELETLLHEFGHALHGLLSNTRYASNGGTNVQLDFVEAPSQMLEEWVYDARVLALFKDVCPELQARARRPGGTRLEGARLRQGRRGGPPAPVRQL